jgi:alpha-beta hydrolase superfamily lysophospholipase
MGSSPCSAGSQPPGRRSRVRGATQGGEGFMPVNGAQLFYSARGAGPSLVLVHGGLASGAIWASVAAALAGEFLVLTPDGRGHGRSNNPSGALSYSALADDLAALIGALELREPVVAGWSLVDPQLAVALFRALAHGELAIVPYANHPAPATAERRHVFAHLIADFARRHGAGQYRHPTRSSSNASTISCGARYVP